MTKNTALSNYSSTRFLANVLLSSGLVLCMIKSFYYDNPFSEILWFVLIFVSMYHIIFMNGLSLLISTIATLFTSVGTCVYLVIEGKWHNLLLSIQTFIETVYRSIQGYEYIYQPYQDIIIILLCGILSLFIFFLSVKKSHFKTICILGILFFSTQWIFGIFASKIGFYIFIFALFIFYFDIFYQKNGLELSSSTTGFKNFTLWVVTTGGLLLGILFNLNHFHQIQFLWLHDVVTSTSDYLNEHFPLFESENGGSAQDTSVSFDDDQAYLGGDIYKDQTIVLQVDSPRIVYLKGSVKDYYDGLSWRGTAKETTLFDPNSIHNGVVNHLPEIQHSLNSIPLLDPDPEYVNKYFYSDTISITFKNISSKSIFIPQMTKEIHFLSDQSDPQYFTHLLYDDIVTDTPLGEGFTYELTALTPKYNDKAFKDLLRKSKIGLLQEQMNDSNKQLIKQSNNYYNVYLQLPERLPSRVRKLAQSLTENMSNNYDKVKVLEQYLAQNYTYNLTPPPKPEKADFVDYFLFEGKEGYCTYYASALTILVRSLGIPARYVEGFLLPAHDEPDESDYYQYMMNPYYYEEDTSYTVRNEQAHAWTEVYFEGFGWLVFEPTSPFEAVYNTEDYSYLSSTTTNYALNPTDTDSWFDFLLNKDFLNIMKKLFIILAFPLLILLFLLYKGYKQIKFKKKSSKEKIFMMYQHMIHWFGLIGYSKKPSETPSQYAQRIDQRIYLDPVTFQMITDIFIRVRYSPEVVKDEDLHEIKEFYTYMKKRTKKYVGIGRYWLYKLLGKI